jgi:hypothetical protein
MQFFLKKVLNFRKNTKAIHEGKTIHFAPYMGTYILFRIIDEEIVVLILNKNDKPFHLDLKRYSEIGLEGKILKNVISGEKITWDTGISFTKRGVTLLTTKLN